MKLAKRFLTGLLTLSLATTPFFTVSAADNTIRHFDDYVSNAISNHLTSQAIITEGEITYSDPIALYNFDTFKQIGSEVIILEDGEYLGKMDVYIKNGEYSSLFDTYLPSEICDEISTGTNIAFGYANDNLLFYSPETGYILADGFNEYEEPICAPEVLTELCFDNSFEFISRYSARSIATYNLDVTRVPNETVDGRGLCVYAATAMLLNYHECGSNLTASQLYSEAKTLTESKGDPARVTALFEEYGYDVTTIKNPIPAGDVAVQLYNGIPLMISITSESGSSHEVVISGISLDAKKSTFTIVDPNKSSTATLNISHSNPNVVQSTITYGSYTTWKTTRY